MKTKITKRSVEAVVPATRDTFLWDAQLPGFGCKVTPAGRRVYVLQTYVKGRLKRVTLGQHGKITAEQARDLATDTVARVVAGQDPAAIKREERSAPTVDELANRYLAEHAEIHKKPRRVDEDRRNLKLHVRPALGTLRVCDVARQHIAKLQHSMRETPTAADRVIALISTMFGMAERWGLRPDGSNPCRPIERSCTELSHPFMALPGDHADTSAVAREIPEVCLPYTQSDAVLPVQRSGRQGSRHDAPGPCAAIRRRFSLPFVLTPRRARHAVAS